MSVISPANITITGNDAQSTENVAALTSRDASTANGSLVNTLTLQQAQDLQNQQKAQFENQQAAALVGSVMANAIGDIAAQAGWGPTSPQKLALHGMAGLIEAKIGGGSIAAGVAGGITQEALAPVISTYLTDHNVPKTVLDPSGNEVPNPDYVALMQAGAAIAGAAVGALVGGNTAAAANGASVALTGITNNFLNHTQAAAMNKQLNDCKAKSGGCSTEEETKIFDTYKQLSDTNISQVQACKFLGDATCVNNLLSTAAAPGEVMNNTLTTQQESVLYGRANNAANLGSVTGSTALDGKDAQQAQQVALFRATKCQGLDSAGCDALVLKTMAGNQIAGLTLVGTALGVAPAAAVAAAAPGAISATSAAIRACASNPVLCANQAGLVAADVMAGDALGGASVAGGTAAAVGAVKKADQVIGEVAARTAVKVDSTLLEQLASNGVKFTAQDVVATGRLPTGQIVFLERGSSASGLQHIIEEHGAEFAQAGISSAQIPGVLMQALTEGRIVGYQGAGTGRPIYEISIGGQQQRFAITVGGNGYIVGANPRGSGQ